PFTSGGRPAMSPIPFPFSRAGAPPADPYHGPPAAVYVGIVGYPRMLRVRQHVDAPAVGDVRRAVRNELARIGITQDVRRGESIAITAGSRGIVDIVPILQTVVATPRQAGADPFLVPAMGSHR